MQKEEKEKKKLRISVRNLVEFILRSGDIDNRKLGLAEKDAMLAGGRIHRKIQGKMGAGYQAEVPLSLSIEEEDFCFLIEGRADGIFSEKKKGEEEHFFIDEIKGVYRNLEFLKEPEEIHLAQAKCYAYFYASKMGYSRMGIQMTYCQLETEEIRQFRSDYSVEELEKWFSDLIGAYKRWARWQAGWEKKRTASVKELQFPFSWREGQKELAVGVYRTILRKKMLFLQASTGTGKTLSVVFPAVKAVGEGLAEKIFYMTGKTVTRAVAEEAFALLHEKGLFFHAITLTAKEKICFCETTECNPDFCPYAKGHYDRVNDAVYEMLTQQEQFGREQIRAQAEKWKVCPFEFSLDLALWMDGVICDYNHVFDPQAKLKRFFGENGKGEYLFLVDEAHNLVDRGREMFSAALQKEMFLEGKQEVKEYSKKLAGCLERCNRYLLEKKRECEGYQVLESLGTFPLQLMNLTGAIEDFMEALRILGRHGDTGMISGQILARDKISELREQPELVRNLSKKIQEIWFCVKSFLSVCDSLNEDYVIYTEHTDGGNFQIRLFCIDIAGQLQECLSKGRSTIFFSATMLPIGYYKKLLGTGPEDYAIYAHSPFEKSQRRVLIGMDTCSRYSNRTEKEYQKIAEYILKVLHGKEGNYMVFFSSYRMLEETVMWFEKLIENREETKGHIEILRQKSGMQEEEREAFLQKFHVKRKGSLVGFCVMGGIFGEGIDLQHDRLIGALIVGTGIPQICHERELLKQFYDRKKEDGFFYAYLCPGVNKVLQSAGRVIRTDKDRGMILLLDERFASARYQSMFPEEWGKAEPCTLHNIEDKVKNFWTEKGEKS